MPRLRAISEGLGHDLQGTLVRLRLSQASRVQALESGQKPVLFDASQMPKFTHHIFVCCNQRPVEHARGCCDPDGAESLRARFKAELKRRGISREVRANRAGCLDQCELGPTVVIYPQAIWYGGVQLTDVERIIDETVVGGAILEDLAISEDLLNTKAGRQSRPSSSGPSAENSSGPGADASHA